MPGSFQEGGVSDLGKPRRVGDVDVGEMGNDGRDEHLVCNWGKQDDVSKVRAAGGHGYLTLQCATWHPVQRVPPSFRILGF